MNTTTLLLGDCLERMEEIPDNSIDSIVTDPPYGLGKEPDAVAMLRDWIETGHHEVKGKGFMGKEWDAFVPQPLVWRECLRVLKPGGHLLAFAGTRTQDLMCLGLRLAGFEIRDMVAWVYGQGFPKSLNIGCKCGVGALPYAHEECVSREPKPECNLRSLRDANVSTPVGSSEGRGEVLQSGLSEQSASVAGWSELPSSEIRQGQPSLEGRRDLLEETRELQADQICQMSNGMPANGEEGRVHHGASPSNGANDRKVLDETRGCPSHQSRSTGQQAGELGVISEQQRAQKGGGRACEKCGGIIGFEGFGTALKPSLEPITLARKPLDGTVAANVLKWHVGGLNIDGCRVKTNENLNGGAYSDGGNRNTLAGDSRNGSDAGMFQAGKTTGSEFEQPMGRWPANLIHDGSDEVLALFPESKGQQGDLKGHAKQRESPNGVYGKFPPAKDAAARNDSGSAARFFYCAKTSKADRNHGLDGTLTVKHNTGLCKEENMDLVELLQRVTSASTAKWGIDESGASITVQCQLDSLSITLMVISKITTSQICSLLTHSPINESIADANCETESGGSHVENAERLSVSPLNTMSVNQVESVLGVSSVVSKMLLAISDVENWKPATNFHATVKPTALMRYLCRLITPPNGMILDPYMGSGSTGKAAMMEGFSFAGIEQDESYFAIAEARIKAAKDHLESSNPFNL